MRGLLICVLLAGCGRDSPASEDLELVARLIFEALKRDDFGSLSPLIPTSDDIAEIQEHFGARVAPADTPDYVRGCFKDARWGPPKFGRIGDPAPSEVMLTKTDIDWERATFGGIEERCRVSESIDPSSAVLLSFVVQVGRRNEHLFTVDCNRVNRGWIVMALHYTRGRIQGQTEETEEALRRCRRMHHYVRQWIGDTGRAPPTDLTVMRSLHPISSRDPWDHDLVIEIRNEREYRIWSLGPDGQQGTDDDLCWPWPGSDYWDR